MKIPLARLAIVATVLLTTLAPRFAAAAYVVRTFNVGDNLFTPPLHFAFNTLSNVFAATPVTHGTTVSLWNPATLSYDTTSTFNANNGSWSVNFTLVPGTGARLSTATSFQAVFLGDVLNHDGSPWNGSDPFSNPPPYAGPAGTFLLGDKTPIANTGNDIFLHLLGRQPNIGEQVSTLTSTSTYLGAGLWDNLPVLGVSEAAFLHVAAVPEPTAAILLLLGLGLGCGRGRKA